MSSYQLIVLVISLFISVHHGNAAERTIEDRFDECCYLGSSWKHKGHQCDNYTDWTNLQAQLPTKHQKLCLKVVEVCCRGSTYEDQCQRGIKRAQQKLPCSVRSNGTCPANPLGDYKRDCCEGCELGILAASLGAKCGFRHFSLDYPFNSAFLACCMMASTDNIDLGNQLDNNLYIYTPKVTDRPKVSITKCPPGYERSSTLEDCQDINECQRDSTLCPRDGEVCANTIGSYICRRIPSCGSGYTLNASTQECEDINECDLGTHSCPKGYRCRNTIGSHRCHKIIKNY